VENCSITEGESAVSISIFRDFERSLVWPKYRLLEIRFQWFPRSFEEPVYLLGYDWTTEEFWFNSCQGHNIYHLFKVSRLASGSKNPRPERVRESLSPKIKSQGYKDDPRKGYEIPEGEYRYNSTLPLTSASDGDGWSVPRPGRFTPGNESRQQFCKRLGGS